MFKAPTLEQLRAIREYAETHGRMWKAHLRSEWETGQTEPLLQQVRNQLGPGWLNKFSLNKDTRI